MKIYSIYIIYRREKKYRCDVYKTVFFGTLFEETVGSMQTFLTLYENMS